METIQCTRCATDYVRQSRRSGTIDRVLSMLRMFPFRCQLCTHRFWVIRLGQDFDATPNDEKREYQRFAVNIPATFRGEQNSGKGRITTLAIRGACLETESRLEHGTRVSLTLSLPGMHPPVEIETAVVRAALGKRFGLEFLEIDSLDEELLRSHIETLIVTGPGELRKMYLNL
jgi:PilZ domain